jgi:hypothetical protein
MSFVKGRCIRCEPAKAHRTLLISFRPLSNSTLSSSTSSRPSDLDTVSEVDASGLDVKKVKYPEWVRLRRPDPRSRYVPSFIAHPFLDIRLALTFLTNPLAIASSRLRLTRLPSNSVEMPQIHGTIVQTTPSQVPVHSFH